ncbi:MAG: hypothetical protein CMC18_03715 [Flavobacteriaceae bacterium]|nr:hypothetical protein [Flavobacteriaceae bacterium]
MYTFCITNLRINTQTFKPKKQVNMSNITLNKSKTTKGGFITLYLRIRLDRRSISVPLNIKLKASQWNGRVINHSYASDLNKWINEEKARLWELVSLYEIKRLTYAQLRDKAKGQDKSYEQVLHAYLEEKPNVYSSAFNKYKTIVGAVEVTNEGLNEFIKGCQQSPATVKSYVNVVKAVHTDLVRLGHAERIEYDLIKITQKPVRNRATTVSEVVRRIEDAKPEDYHYHALAVFSLLNGGFYYTDAKVFKGEDYHARSKTGVLMPVAKESIELFNTIDLSKAKEYFFSRKTVGFKRLRRLYETVATNIGVDFTIRRQLLGHAISDISKHYYDTKAKESEEKLREAQKTVLKHLRAEYLLKCLRQLYVQGNAEK